ncbi:MAG: glycosyltransferase [Candidatus Gottesmanbacteria bacterium]|nr:glycosyltransferase [Candidatus Gottesmanbacteria bacterium]
MKNIWKFHVFTAELPYEKDQIVTLFLRERFERVDSFIMSLGQMSTLPPSKLSTYLRGKLVNEKTYTKNDLNTEGLKLYFIYIPKALLSVILDMLRALKTINFTCDIFFAQHFLAAFVAIILKKTGFLHCQKIIFWMFDFFPVPPEFPRGLYYRGMDAIHGFIRKHLDEIWYATPRLLECDKERFGPLPKSVQVRLTHGCFFRRIPTPKPPTPPPLRLAFLGSIRRNNAIYETIDTVRNCIDHGMDVELHIIGSGPEEIRVKEYVKRYALSHAITFYGFEDRGEKISKILSKCHLGLALYSADPYGPNWYLTSGKFRRYISQYLPVITTSVPYFAKYIHDYHAGLIVDNDSDEIRRTLLPIYNNPSLLNNMRSGVDKLYDMYKADTILEKAFRDMLSAKR